MPHNKIFLHARTYNFWLDKPVEDQLLEDVYDLTKMAPTSANCQPLRILFIKSPEAKARLKPYLAEGNADKAMSAPVTAIFAHDLEFYEHLPHLFPHTDARSWFKGKPNSDETAFRNGTLQAGYFMLAARLLGLDCGPMSGFDNIGIDNEFLAGTSWKSNFLCNLGYGDASKLHPRSPRPEFSDFCKIL
jgi:3-hydroxypropanoate dehydrogenase